ncbi:DsbA family oxidoreductase [Stappia sp. P2PMeth1]|uniref:DsbA family oxidoreductase n=1 Tax=Stappia sp. P2PMeth1 TaxID=2003586 RepID=UPI0016487AAC|nr:DsbA family oxidoreductase [Stappia sp. P2PMeth1]
MHAETETDTASGQQAAARTAADQAAMPIDVISDVVCPWCYIGKRRLEKALASLPDIPVALRWQPYQLDATIPPQGKDRQQYLMEKFGSQARIDALHEQIAAAGLQEGIPFAFERIRTSPNTLDCHRLLLWSRADGLQSEMAERLFRLYFLEGADLSDPQTLVMAAGEVGMMADLVAELLPTDSDRNKITAAVEQAHRIGVTGVPAFIIDERFIVMGAEKPETLAAAIKHAYETKAG